MAKQSNQRNGITKRGSKYLVRIGIPDPALGENKITGEAKKRIVRIGSFRTMEEAEKARNEAQYKADKGLRLVSSSLTVEDHFRSWIGLHALSVKPSTGRGYVSIVETKIIPKLGRLPISKLKTHHLEEFYAYLLREGKKGGIPLSTRSVEQAKTVLKLGLDNAVKVAKLIPQNPALEVKTPKVKNKKNILWTTEQVQTFLNYVSENSFPKEGKKPNYYKRLVCFFRLSLYTGARSGELLGLKWGDFDPIEGKIDINKTRSRGSKSETITGSTKTGKPRPVYLDPLTVSMLQTHKTNQDFDKQVLQDIGGVWADTNYIFTDAWGQPLGDRTAYQVLKRAIVLLGLPDQRLHDFRAWHITDQLEQGISPHEVADRVGAKAETLMKHYARVNPARRSLVANQFAKRMDQKLIFG